MIGSNLVKRLAANGVRVKVVDNLWRGKLEYLLDDDRCVSSSTSSATSTRSTCVFRAHLKPLLHDVDLVIHLADVVAGIGYVFNNQGWIFRQNMLINSNVVASVRTSSVRSLMYVGTACSFPAALQTGVDAAPLRESDMFQAAPESAYGWSKLMGHYEVDLLAEETDIATSVLVLHNVYGTPTDFTAHTGQVIPSLVRKAIRYPDEPFTVWGSGAQGRAFVHVDDVVDRFRLGEHPRTRSGSHPNRAGCLHVDTRDR